MGFVRMQHHGLAGAAGAHRAAIMELLHAIERHADRIAIVAVRIVGMAVEARRQPAHAGAGLVLPEEVLQLGHAQTFKTVGAEPPLLQT